MASYLDRTAVKRAALYSRGEDACRTALIMKVKAVVAFIVGLVAVVTALNFLMDNFRLMSSLPENRVEHARREALQKPFYEREHRLERQPRLESGETPKKRTGLRRSNMK